jgi:Domain of unknown function (DUF3786)
LESSKLKLKEKSNKSTNYEDALNVAWELFHKTDLKLQAERCGGVAVCGDWDETVATIDIGESGDRRDDFKGEVSGIEVKFMNRRYLLSIDNSDVVTVGGAEVPIHYKILILHCFLYHNGKKPDGEWISFLDIKDGLLYSNIYKSRTSLPLKYALKDNPRLLIDAAERLGGGKSDTGGDVSATIEPFHNMPIAVIFYEGDEDFPPESTFLFDKGIRDILPAEDVVVLAECLGREIRKYIKEKG